MNPIEHLSPQARRRQRRAASETAKPDAPDPNADWRRMMDERMADLEVARSQARHDVKVLAKRWRQEARRERASGSTRRALFYEAAADALEGWAYKVFSATTVWPGL